jgi:hypothetical protein
MLHVKRIGTPGKYSLLITFFIDGAGLPGHAYIHYGVQQLFTIPGILEEKAVQAKRTCCGIQACRPGFYDPNVYCHDLDEHSTTSL